MKVQSIKKIDLEKYQVIIDDKEYIFNEDTLVKLKITSNKDIGQEVITKLLLEEMIVDAYKKALNYHLRYAKSSKECFNYLKSKDISLNIIEEAIARLVANKIINDETLAINIASSYARNSNGPLLIKHKLKQHQFSEDIIRKALENIEQSDYDLGLNKLLIKANKKFAKLEEKNKIIKIKNFIYQRGYTEYKELHE